MTQRRYTPRNPKLDRHAWPSNRYILTVTILLTVFRPEIDDRSGIQSNVHTQ